MSKLFVVFIFIFLVEVVQFATASIPPSQLNCTTTRNGDGSFTYTLIPAPTVTERGSTSWANGTDHVFVVDNNFSELVLNITEDSLTLKWCEEVMVFMHNGETQQEARCHGNCSLYAAVLPPPPPSANHTFCLSEHLCPPVWAVVLLFLVPVLVLVLVLVVVWCKMKGSRCRGRRSKKGKEIYKIVKNGDPAGGSEVTTVFDL